MCRTIWRPPWTEATGNFIFFRIYGTNTNSLRRAECEATGADLVSYSSPHQHLICRLILILLDQATPWTHEELNEGFLVAWWLIVQSHAARDTECATENHFPSLCYAEELPPESSGSAGWDLLRSWMVLVHFLALRIFLCSVETSLMGSGWFYCSVFVMNTFCF